VDDDSEVVAFTALALFFLKLGSLLVPPGLSMSWRLTLLLLLLLDAKGELALEVDADPGRDAAAELVRGSGAEREEDCCGAEDNSIDPEALPASLPLSLTFAFATIPFVSARAIIELKQTCDSARRPGP